MKLIYNDGTDLQIQSASIQGDGTLLIKTVSATEEDLRGMFGDELKTRKMVISERSQTVGEYEGYTTLEGITKYTAGIIGIILSKPGETVAEKMDALIRENADLKEQKQTLSGEKEKLERDIENKNLLFEIYNDIYEGNKAAAQEKLQSVSADNFSGETLDFYNILLKKAQ